MTPRKRLDLLKETVTNEALFHSRHRGRGRGGASRSCKLKVTQEPDEAAMGQGGGLGGDSAGWEGANRVGQWMWHLMGNARSADSAGKRGQGGPDPTLGAEGLWMMLLSALVHAWYMPGTCLATPDLARVAQPDPL